MCELYSEPRGLVLPACQTVMLSQGSPQSSLFDIARTKHEQRAPPSVAVPYRMPTHCSEVMLDHNGGSFGMYRYRELQYGGLVALAFARNMCCLGHVKQTMDIATCSADVAQHMCRCALSVGTPTTRASSAGAAATAESFRPLGAHPGASRWL